MAELGASGPTSEDIQGTCQDPQKLLLGKKQARILLVCSLWDDAMQWVISIAPGRFLATETLQYSALKKTKMALVKAVPGM